jgi:hypothetical protein
MSERDPVERFARRPSALARGGARVEKAVGDVLQRAVRLEQVELLEDEADPPRAQRSSVPMMCSSVDLPDPDGPMIAHSSPSSMLMFTPRSASTPPG